MTVKRSFGSVRRLPSGSYQARYTAPDGRMYSAPRTFTAKGHADAWLAARHVEVSRGTWQPPSVAFEHERPVTFEEYSTTWLAGRDLKPRTREHYRALLHSRLLPAFGACALAAITPAEVRRWYAATDATKPTIRAHTYALLRTILNTAVADDLMTANPCRIVGAGATKRARAIRPASLPELEALTTGMPDRLRAMVLLAAWCALRFGELAELRRADVDLTDGIVRVRRGVVRVNGEIRVGTPKSDAGIRDVAVPPHLLPVLRQHLDDHVEPGSSALLFPATDGRNLSPNSLYWHFSVARSAAGRPDLRFHDLRHTGAVLAASTGATLAELMARLGHSTSGAAMKYQHAAADRDRAIAAALSRLVDDSPA